MKRIAFLLTALFFGLQMAQAQDLITTKNGEDIQAKVLEVGLKTVKYKKFSNLEGPEYTMLRDEILIIRYENGEKDIFNDDPFRESFCIVRPGAPVHEGMRYREYKRLYSTRGYIRQDDDRYDPFAAGVASYFIPGMGQCISGEWGRGVTFFLGTGFLGTMSVVSGFLSSSDYYYSYDSQYGQNYYYDHSAETVFYSLAFATVYIWNICDAVKVAKVKNLYYRDLYGNSQELKLHIEPYLNFNPVANPTGNQMAGGLSLKVDF